jgi:hypothetical protein
VADVDARLQAWGAWLDAGGRVAGYASTSPLHPSWLPPAAGGHTLRSAPRGDGGAREVHSVVAGLPLKLRDALVISYVLKLPTAERARRAGCSPSGFSARVQRARRLVDGALRAESVVGLPGLRIGGADGGTAQKRA